MGGGGKKKKKIPMELFFQTGYGDDDFFFMDYANSGERRRLDLTIGRQIFGFNFWRIFRN